MKSMRLLNIFIVINLFVYAQAADTLSIFQRIDSNTPIGDKELFTLVYENPAMNYDRYSTTLNDIYVGYEDSQQSQSAIQQLGSGYTHGTVSISSFIVEGANRLWGDVHYSNGIKRDVFYNETSDYELLYPYVMADTLGGDLYYEEYYFSGGYGYRTSRFTLGIEGAYRATLSYRNQDPRPKNLVGDLTISLGASYQLYNSYTLGASLLLNKYKQTNELEFYNTQGVPNIYHLTGLGNDYYRFQGANGNVFFQGYTYGGSLNILPFKAASAGITASLQFQYFTFDKILSDLNELPINAIREYNWAGELAWRNNPTNRNKWGIKLLASTTNRIGSEYIYGTVSGVIYPLISTPDYYYNNMINAELTASFEQTTSSSLSYSIRPSLQYMSIATEYISPLRTMDIDRLQSGITLASRHTFKEWMLRTSATCNYTTVLENDLSLYTTEVSQLDEPVYSAYNYLSSKSIEYDISLRADYMIAPSYTIYASCNYTRNNFISYLFTNYLKVSVGISF